METIIKTYLSEKKNDSEMRKSEFEVRFTNNGKRFTKLEYDDIMKHLMSLGFKSVELNGNHLLRIGVDYNNNLSLLRVEINELSDIKFLCKSGELPARFDVINKNKLGTYKNDDYSFSVNLAEEKKIKNNIVDTIKEQWKVSKKTFRFMNRVRLYHPDIPHLFVDCSIIQSSRFERYKMVAEVTIEQSNLFNNPESYEIEIEIDNEVNDLIEIKQLISKGVKYIVGGIQHSIYPVSYKELNEVEQQYLKLVKLNTNDYNKFIGLMPLTLERHHIQHIKVNYTVTEKADGIRKLLFINEKGKMYYITRSMQIEYTGKQLTSQDTKYLHNTIIDGEHIMFSKQKDYINLFACFDIYFLNNKDQRNLNFFARGDNRIGSLQSTMETLSNYLTIQSKEFLYITEDQSIFDNCHKILNKTYIYEIDGLIFTPATSEGYSKSKNKNNWEISYKWKPSEHNSIDFLVMTKKDETGKDEISYQYLNGLNMTGDELLQYKTVFLNVGFSGIANPCQLVLNDVMLDRSSYKSYNPAKFYPSNPSDETAHICNIPLKMGNDGTMQMFTEDNEIITDKMIVEFKYVMDSEKYWAWKPMRIRWDKTFEYKTGGRNYGNGYHVADSVWRSIHYPITYDMITTGKGIDEEINDVYYVESLVEKRHNGLSNFHNYIKRELIRSTTGNNGTIIDFAVGKGGDLDKWNDVASFVVGIDVSRDCIENAIDGACIRYLQYKEKHPISTIKCIFLRGDSSKHIRSGKAFQTDKDFEIIKAIFGDEKPKESLGKGVIQQYNVAGNGFDVASVQFAIHYFFKSSETFYTFLQNVNESVKEGGYFIGTCYDGDTVFELLKEKERENGVLFGTIENKLCEIIKYYDQEEFPNDERSLGYEIGVYMNTIGQVLKEYLVNFTFLTNVLQEYGFELVNGTNKSWGNATGSFKDVYKYVEHYSKTRKMHIGNTLNMTPDEKNISFLNRYFIFKKMRHVDKRITKTIQEPKYNIKKNKKKILIKSSNE
jgi:mRNA capping enzyme/mRNA capping enzyme, catalytic domain